jgi:hypothetical protein
MKFVFALVAVAFFKTIHVTPIRAGGDGRPDNGQLLCGGCHTAKSRQERRARLAQGATP